MAGCGRNVGTVKGMFRDCEITIVDIAEGMIKDAILEKRVTDSETRLLNVEQFPWKEHEQDFGLILGWWCLCYLPADKVAKLLVGARNSLKKPGYLVFAEPVCE